MVTLRQYEECTLLEKAIKEGVNIADISSEEQFKLMVACGRDAVNAFAVAYRKEMSNESGRLDLIRCSSEFPQFGSFTAEFVRLAYTEGYEGHERVKAKVLEVQQKLEEKLKKITGKFEMSHGISDFDASDYEGDDNIYESVEMFRSKYGRLRASICPPLFSSVFLNEEDYALIYEFQPDWFWSCVKSLLYDKGKHEDNYLHRDYDNLLKDWLRIQTGIRLMSAAKLPIKQITDNVINAVFEEDPNNWYDGTACYKPLLAFIQAISQNEDWLKRDSSIRHLNLFGALISAASDDLSPELLNWALDCVRGKHKDKAHHSGCSRYIHLENRWYSLKHNFNEEMELLENIGSKHYVHMDDLDEQIRYCSKQFEDRYGRTYSRFEKPFNAALDELLVFMWIGNAFEAYYPGRYTAFLGRLEQHKEEMVTMKAEIDAMIDKYDEKIISIRHDFCKRREEQKRGNRIKRWLRDTFTISSQQKANQPKQ